MCVVLELFELRLLLGVHHACVFVGGGGLFHLNNTRHSLHDFSISSIALFHCIPYSLNSIIISQTQCKLMLICGLHETLSFYHLTVQLASYPKAISWHNLMHKIILLSTVKQKAGPEIDICLNNIMALTLIFLDTMHGSTIF